MRKSRGVTLITLVVTIIILLILAGITILKLNRSNLFRMTKEAKIKHEGVQEKEEMELIQYTKEIDNYINGSRETVTLTEEEYQIFKNITTYSNEEKIVGKWKDNKNIYQKTIDIPEFPYGTGTNKYIDTGIETKTVDTLVELNGTCYNFATFEPLPFYHIDNVHGFSIFLYKEHEGSKNLTINLRRSASNTALHPFEGGYVTLKYTKVTEN